MSKFLLDTHTFIWWVEDSPDLSVKAREIIAEIDNECYLSLASCWEMAIKSSLGKLQLALPLGTYIPQHMAANRFEQLGISFQHISRVESLPFHHRDPFDRLLAAQTLENKMTLISRDSSFALYGVERLW